MRMEESAQEQNSGGEGDGQTHFLGFFKKTVKLKPVIFCEFSQRYSFGEQAQKKLVKVVFGCFRGTQSGVDLPDSISAVVVDAIRFYSQISRDEFRHDAPTDRKDRPASDSRHGSVICLHSNFTSILA